MLVSESSVAKFRLSKYLSQKQASILIVNNSRFMTSLIMHALLARGFDVKVCMSNTEALDLLHQYHFDLVLLEFEQSDLNGLDFLFWLKQSKPHLPVIVMSSYFNDELQSFLMEHKVFYFEKSRHIDTLVTVIELKIQKNNIDLRSTKLMLFELALMCCFSGQRHCIQLQDTLHHYGGKIWFDHHQIVHAECLDLEGEEALIFLFRIKQGTFLEIPWIYPESETMDLSFDSLMMALTVLIDEPIASVKENRAYDVLSILIIESNPDESQLLTRFFQSQNFRVQTVETGEKALSLLRYSPINLILCDYQLSDMPAQAFLEKVQLMRINSKVILFGEHLETQVTHFSGMWGVLGCFSKPVILKELAAFVRYLFSERYFSGKVRSLDIVHFLRTLCCMKGTCAFQVNDLASNLNGVLLIENGLVVHATLGEFVGAPAFQAILKIQRGFLSELEREIRERTIEVSPIQLLIHAMLLEDFHNETKRKVSNPFFDPQPSRINDFLEKNILKSQLIIDTQTADFMGIRIGESTAQEAIAILKKLGGQIQPLEDKELYCPEIDLIVKVDQQEIVEEIQFNQGFKGKTSMGVGIGDKPQDALFVYGQPRFQSEGFCIWDQVAFFFDLGKINRITLGAI